MGVLQVQNICLAFGDRDILSNVNLSVESRTRAALAGGNGEGKSTLMKIIAGIMQQDSGIVTKSKESAVAYLPQSDIVLKDSTVYDEIASDIKPELVENGLVNKDATVCRIAQGLGFSKSDLSRKCNEFSGGYQMRIALARVLAQNPTFMMLDEPTNYLDIEARMWLRSFIKTYRGALLLVCHDKGFLDDTVNEVYELFNGKLTHYSGNYSFYEKQRKLELEQLESAWKKQQDEIEKTEEFIERFRYKATKAKQVQSRVKMLEKIDPIVVPGHLRTLNFSFAEPPHSPNDMVVVDHLTKRYSPSIVPFTDFSLIVSKGQRLAVTGHNGIGKSTLLRIIAQQDFDIDGSAKLGSGVKVGYYSQDTADSLNLNNTVLEEVLPYGSEGKMRNALGSFLFSGDDIFKSVGVLSGGERSRLALLKVLLQTANLLILDEPTNHLDINAKDMLLKALEDYRGTIIFVSHDAYFIRALATDILYLSSGKPQLFNGDYDYFEWKMSQNLGLAEEKQIAAKQETKTASVNDYALSNKLRNEKKKLEKEVSALADKVLSLENEIKQVKDDMNKEENYSDHTKITALADRLALLEKEKEQTEEQWLEKTELLS